MKLYKANSTELFDENKNLVGKMFANFISGMNVRLEIGNRIYKLRYSGFLYSVHKFYDEKDNVVLMIDSMKKRILYYDNPYTEIYHFKHGGWFSAKTSLYKFENDELLIQFKQKKSFFNVHYEIEVSDKINNDLLIWAFTYFNINALQG